MSQRWYLDVKIVIGVLVVWMCIVAVATSLMGFTNSTYFVVGPNSETKFFGVKIDTWSKWSFVAIYIVINQFLQTYGLETITPWMINTVQNKSAGSLGQTPTQTVIVLQLWTIYLWSGRIFGIMILFSQIDFLCLVLLVDMIATAITTQMYIKLKQTRHDDSQQLINADAETV